MSHGIKSSKTQHYNSCVLKVHSLALGAVEARQAVRVAKRHDDVTLDEAAARRALGAEAALEALATEERSVFDEEAVARQLPLALCRETNKIINMVKQHQRSFYSDTDYGKLI